MQLTIKAGGGKAFDIEIPDESTVQQLKKAIEAQESGLSAASIRLIYSGKILADASSLQSYGITSGHAIHMVVAKSQGARPAGPPTSPLPDPTPPPQPQGPSTGGFPMPGMGVPGMGMPDLSQMFQNVDFGQLLNNPVVQNMMREMTENPQMMADMVRMNPMFANNPMFQELVDNPELLRQQMRAAQQMLPSLGVGAPTPGAAGAVPPAGGAAPPAGGAAPNPMAGFGAPGMPGMPDLAGMMNTPMFHQMMNHFMENPQALGDMMRMNPMMANNPYMQQVLNNPEEMREHMRSMGEMFSGGGDGFGAAPGSAPTANPAPFGGVAPPPQQINQHLLTRLLGIPVQPEHNRSIANNAEIKRGLTQILQGILMCRSAGLPLFSDVGNIGPITTQSLGMLNPGGVGSAAAPAAPAAEEVVLTPEQRFGPQLTQMNDMGFLDNQRNVQALIASNGNVSVAIEWLLNH
jgi:ubiquilin